MGNWASSKSMNTVTAGTQDGLFGVIPYVAPEILKACPHTIRSDIYSLGVLLWEISSGKSPFESHIDHTIIATILSGIREERIPDTPEEYYKLYSKCWNDEPENRYTIEDVYEILENLLNVGIKEGNVSENEGKNEL